MNIAIVLAGGLGLRMSQDGAPPKQFYSLADKPVLIHTLERFENHSDIDAICVVCLPTWEDYLRDMVGHYGLLKIRWIVSGGSVRQESVYNGLCAIETECPRNTMVLVHDGVRPFITSDIITQNIVCANEHGNAMTGMKSTDTLIMSSDGLVSESAMEREHTYSIQTPQTYRLDYGLSLYRKAMGKGMTQTINCCELFIALGEKVYIVKGRKSNLKLTTKDDIAYLKFLHSIFHESGDYDE